MYAKYVGISADTAALIEARRLKADETEDEIIARELRADAESEGGSVGCDLGQGALLREGEKMYCFRYKSSRDAGRPEAVAQARGGNIYLYGARITPSKGSLVQPALRAVQERIRDRNEKGDMISLDAWEYWFVRRNGQFIPVGQLRDPSKIVRRRRGRVDLSHLDLDLEL